jgi:5-formaminoimidazole-4-carboxamide-1-beta-D-ribofuranosyl 5'-monophosphate synthetase
MSKKEQNELIQILKEMTLKYPNDQELGREIRKYVIVKTKQSKS